ncbi:DUF2625 family protein [Cellulomonas denverensis]|uniref:DUF2625 family protein n=1 Tax=Cellulomonas denverensis TaxID=264297 RepID=A0A7X6KWN8_9CELL|nr:DUF2625 family protein [Cellulomonas denverensis]NKY23565.1 DUF2625 family protein [Cellulomonas denverensis]GIG26834.1 hypothetical protein Cde04nite_30780 [Cellulomonas denverensis]
MADPTAGIRHLIDPDDAWPLIQDWAAQSPTPVTVLPADPERAAHTLAELRVSTRSPLGALAWHCGGLVADSGWFRLLGGGTAGLPDLVAAGVDLPGAVVVGYDALGGTFAVDGGGLGVAPGEVCYFGPDSLAWGGLGGGHGAFVQAVLTGALAEPFASLRWPGWQAEVAALSLDQGLSLWPPPFTAEGRDVAAVARRAVPLTELLGFYAQAGAQL